MQQRARSVALAFNNLPRSHRIMLGTLTAITLAAFIWRPVVYHTDDTSSVSQSVEMDKKDFRAVLPEASEPLDQIEDFPREDLEDGASSEPAVHDYTVSKGDTLSSILNQYGIDMNDINQLVKTDKALRSLSVGQRLDWTLTSEGQLQQLNWEVSRRETRTFDRNENGFKSSNKIKQGVWQNSARQGVVRGSFVSSAQKAGLTRNEISEVTKALQWQLDFRKLRAGDKFSVVLSREMVNGTSEQSQLIAVRLRTGGKDYYAIRAEDGKFYDRAGAGLARGFMRFPTVKQYRISSGFNPRRTNPVTGRVAPHKGIDFPMPLGTPVLAVGDGEVVVSKRSGAAGNYIAIRHGRQYMTRYMHMKKLLVPAGTKVKRGDRIGLSGNTGRSTGPHLHYELWVNNQAVNPLTASLPRTEGLMGSERTAFRKKVRELIPKLALN